MSSVEWSTVERPVVWRSDADPAVVFQVVRSPGDTGGVTVHNDLTGRGVADAHPISAVTGLQAALDAAGDGGVLRVSAWIGLPIEDLGGSFPGPNDADFPLAVGLPVDALVLLTGQTDGSHDDVWRHTGGGALVRVVPSWLGPDHVGMLIVAGADSSGNPAVGRVTNTGVEVLDVTGSAAAAVDGRVDGVAGRVDGLDGRVDGVAVGMQRQGYADALAETVTRVFRFPRNRETTPWSAPSQTHLFTEGISARCLRRPIRPEDLPSGQSWFAEWFTQAHDGSGDWDNFEASDLWTDDSFPSSVDGECRGFWEQTESGGTTDGSAWWPDLLLGSGQWTETMVTIDFATATGRMWLRVPSRLDDDDDATYHVDADDGALFRLMDTRISAKFASIDAHTEDWWLGCRYAGDIARLIVRDGIDGTLIACPDASLVTPGVTTFTDAAGVPWTAGPQTEVVDLDMGTGEVPAARTITAGTGLTGGGDLTADRTLTVDFGAGAGKVTQGNDSRLSDARTPTAHASAHAAAGADPVTVTQAQVTGLTSDLAGKAAVSHTHATGDITGLGSLAAKSTVTSSDIADGTIIDADISASAAIAQSKVSGLTSSLAGKADTAHAHSASDITSGVIAGARLPPGLLFGQGNGPSVTSTTLVTLLSSSPTITAAVGDYLRIVVGGRWNNQAGSAKSFTVAVSLGGVTVCSMAPYSAISSAAPDRIWKVTIDCFVVSTSSVVCIADGLIGSGSGFTSVSGQATGNITTGLTLDVQGLVASGGSQTLQAQMVAAVRIRA